MPSVGAARNSVAPCLSESSMGMIEDTGFSNIIKYLRLFTELRSRFQMGHLCRGFSVWPGVTSRNRRIFCNFSLANWNLPAIIWCFVSRTRLASAKQG